MTLDDTVSHIRAFLSYVMILWRIKAMLLKQQSDINALIDHFTAKNPGGGGRMWLNEYTVFDDI